MIWLLADPATWNGGGGSGRVLLALGIANLAAGYVAMALLSSRSLALRRRGDLSSGLVGLPLYWLLMSIAAYRAVYELARRPFHWAKTPHAVHAFVRARCPPASVGTARAAILAIARPVQPAVANAFREAHVDAVPLAWLHEA